MEYPPIQIEQIDPTHDKSLHFEGGWSSKAGSIPLIQILNKINSDMQLILEASMEKKEIHIFSAILVLCQT